MLPQRLQAPSLHDLHTSVHGHLADAQAQVTVQFSAPDQYPAPVLAALDALCATYGPRLEVRFYGHYAGAPFDGHTLEALPNVQALSLDCLYQVAHLERLQGLTGLHSLALNIDKVDLNPLVAFDTLRTLRQLSVGQETGPKLDLLPVSRLPHMQAFHLSAKTTGLAPLRALSALNELSLWRQPASTSLEVVATLPHLRELSIGFGSRKTIAEVRSDSVTHLWVCRVRGLQALDLAHFAQLHVLQVEDQPHIACLNLAPCRQLRALRLENLKTLAQLDGMRQVPLSKLSIYKTPALDLPSLLDSPPPTLRSVRLISGKRAPDHALEARRTALGLGTVSGVFE
ncbi:hypothetical protein [Pseudomonas sp. UBA6562]|uniref:hypothetical protein n=1 Tax=Pseudomonas sp. UBA6562 TaxID=1947332 RepID=UPI0025F55C82|nr:hypothetical protein [Pseudomonas sp. UBA6562]